MGKEEHCVAGAPAHCREFYIHSDGLRLHAKLDLPGDRARYPLVIVLHGFTGNMEERHILAVSEAMREVGYATLRVELYGHGQSDGTFAEHNLYKWLNNVFAVTDYARSLDFVTDLYLCGHSQGGLTTMLAAGMMPETFRGILPLSPALSLLTGARNGRLLGVDFDPDHIPDTFEYAGMPLRGTYVRVAQTLYAEPVFSRFKGPVLLIHGDEDELVPFQDSVEAVKLYEHAKLVRIAGDTHGYDFHLDQVTEAVKAFLSAQLHEAL